MEKHMKEGNYVFKNEDEENYCVSRSLKWVKLVPKTHIYNTNLQHRLAR